MFVARDSASTRLLKSTINRLGDTGLAPLHEACRLSGQDAREIVTLLLRHGADVELEDAEGSRAIHHAAKTSSGQGKVGAVVTSLLDNGASPDPIERSTGRTALHHAVAGRDLVTAVALLRNGCDINQREVGSTGPGATSAAPSRTSSSRAAQHRSSRSPAPIQTPSTSSAAAGSQRTALHLAAETGALPLLHALVRGGADLDARDATGETPEETADRVGNLQAMRVLRRARRARDRSAREGTDPAGNGAAVSDDDESDQDQEYLLSREALTDAVITAARDGRVAALRKMVSPGGGGLAAGADPSAVNEGSGVTALHAAARNGRLDCAIVLVKAGANCNALDYDGETPLHAAARAGGAKVVQASVFFCFFFFFFFLRFF
jgi:ankyrin repeat protein